jgi:hypothetical protein
MITPASGGSAETVGVQSMEYNINLNKEDHFEGGSHLRTYVSYGYKLVKGKISIKSTSTVLDALLDKMEEANNGFSLHVDLSNGTDHKVLDFFECYLESKEFGIDVNGNGVSTYAFTARDVQEGA